MGTNTRQREALVGHPLSLHRIREGPKCSPGSLPPPPEPGDNGRRATRARTPAPLSRVGRHEGRKVSRTRGGHALSHRRAAESLLGLDHTRRLHLDQCRVQSSLCASATETKSGAREPARHLARAFTGADQTGRARDVHLLTDGGLTSVGRQPPDWATTDSGTGNAELNAAQQPAEQG
jgi:hypothetical protein